MSIAILGAGAFGSALAISLAQDGRAVTLWGRNPDAMREIEQSRTIPRLPDATLPPSVAVVTDLERIDAETLLLAVPMQTLSQLLRRSDFPDAKHLVACCKGIDHTPGQVPTALIATHRPDATAAILTGPSFAADIAQGLPTALTLACADAATGKTLQQTLTTTNLRLYRSADPVGAELGGALKNVIAIACGLVMGAGFGASARAAAIARGFAEMQRLAQHLGAAPDTLTGLSGFGDLVLTCTSPQSRNFAFGAALGAGHLPASGTTVEGKATATAALALARKHNIDMPITAMVSAVCAGDMNVSDAMRHLIQRELKAE
jgi:glycerol-3-phosphate dehydrogenase (NAD(P)+)